MLACAALPPAKGWVQSGRNRLITVRPAGVDDTPFLTFLRQEHTVLLQQSDQRLISLVPTDFASLLDDEAAVVLVAESDNQPARPVGYIVGWQGRCPLGMLPPAVGYIAELALDAHRYHGGAGRRLVLALKSDFARRTGIEVADLRIIVPVPRYYAVEQAFWRSLGAVEDPAPLFDPLPSRVWMKL
jgi:ribosomal protein S18 acetylase RimI-like enzyme